MTENLRPQSLPRRTFADLRVNRPMGALARAVSKKRGLVFVHVPKCGGTSVERALRGHYRLGRRLIGPEETYEAARTLLGRGDEEADRHVVLQRASELRRDLLHLHLAEGATLVTGHAPLGATTLAAFAATHDFITVMRGPAERMRSHVAYNKNQAAGHGRSELTVTRFLETDRAQVLGALYVKYFAGLPMTADLTSQSAIDAAKRTVDRLALVGFTDAMPLFADKLHALTGLRVRIGHQNKGRETNLPGGAAERIEALCAPDNAVYAHARARFGERRARDRQGQAR